MLFNSLDYFLFYVPAGLPRSQQCSSALTFEVLEQGKINSQQED